jgi:peptidoglycan/LPS O-acetylase OafA/YrhL
MPGFRGEPLKPSWIQLLAHVGYLNALLGQPWLNPAFWSLAIEFQYYLSLGLLFPILSSPNRYIRLSVMSLLSISALLTRSPNLLFSYEFLFLIGIVTFQYKCRIIGIREWTSLALLCTVGEWAVSGGLIALVGAVTSVLILTPMKVFPATALLGDISYSLYLTHTPIGERIIHLGARLPQSPVVSASILVLGLIGSVGFAYLFFRWVEEPSRRLASSIQYRYVGRS